MGRYDRNELYSDAMALTHDNELTTCRETGTAWLQTMGLAKEQLLTKG